MSDDKAGGGHCAGGAAAPPAMMVLGPERMYHCAMKALIIVLVSRASAVLIASTEANLQ
jgi:hypothetical protein